MLKNELKIQSKWLLFAIPIGIIAGLSSFTFLWVLDEVTTIRTDHLFLVFFLPLAGLFIGYIYYKYGGDSSKGTNLVIDQIHEPTKLLPKQMGIFVLFGTWFSHLFGASVGREGTALQVSSSLSEIFFTKFKLITHNDISRKVMLVCAKAGGFSAVFGVPFAGAVFALEVQKIGKLKYRIIVPVVATSFFANYIVNLLGYKHFNYPTLNFSIYYHTSIFFWLKVVLLGAIFGVASNIFSISIFGIKKYFAEKIKCTPMRPFIGGVILVVIFVAIGSKYEGLSIPLIQQSLSGHNVELYVFALKLLVTVIALGFGFIGGEVTPLFVIGTTLGASLAYAYPSFFNIGMSVMAALGLVAVFAGASNTPFASTLIGAELFGVAIALPLLVVSCISYFVSVEKGIYHAQKRPHKFKLVNLVRFRTKRA